MVENGVNKKCNNRSRIKSISSSYFLSTLLSQKHRNLLFRNIEIYVCNSNRKLYSHILCYRQVTKILLIARLEGC